MDALDIHPRANDPRTRHLTESCPDDVIKPGHSAYPTELIPGDQPCWRDPQNLHGLPKDRPHSANDAIHRAFCKARSWRAPPNWSRHDWFAETNAITVAAGYRAEFDFDSQRDVPLGAFVYVRALTSAWTRYRQEWAYCVRFGGKHSNGADEGAITHAESSDEGPRRARLQHALRQLSPIDEWLIEQLFWYGTTELRIGEMLRISQQAVSKRKRRILMRLRRALSDHRLRVLGGEIVAWWTLFLDWSDFAVACDWCL